MLVADRALETSRLKREVKELKQLAPVPTGAGRPLAGDQPAAPDDREGGADQQPHPDRRPVRRRQGAGRAHASTRCRAAPSGPFVVINAAAITPERMEVELFGVEAVERHAARARSARSRRRMAARCSSTKSPTCRARRRTRSCACWSTRPSSASAAPTRSTVDVRIVSSTSRNLEAEIAAGTLPRGSVPPAVGGADPRAAAGRAARGHSRAGRLFHGPDFAARPACRSARIGEDAHGGAAVARLAGQRAPAAQQRRAADDPGAAATRTR